MQTDDRNRCKRILLVLRTDHGFARAVMRGAVRFGRTAANGRWLFEQRLPQLVKPGELDFDGILAGVADEELVKPLQHVKVPVVGVLSWSSDTLWPRVTVDDVAVGRMVGEHFLDRHFTRLAFVGFSRLFARRRLAGFCHVLAERNLAPAVFEGKIDATWLRSVEKPVGVFAVNDVEGRSVINECRAQGLDVPFDVAVVGVDNDDLLCQTVDPPLSSVAVPDNQIGYAAAAILERLMDGKKVERETRLPPGHMVVRGSSDAFATADERVQTILKIVRDHLDQPLDVAKLARLTYTTRSTLVRCLKRELGCKPLDLIHHYRLEKATTLLLETNENLERIAIQCGYRNAVRLVEAFHRHLGRTPDAFRKDPGRFASKA